MRIAVPSNEENVDANIAENLKDARFYIFFDVDMEKRKIMNWKIEEIPFQIEEPGDLALFIKEHEGELLMVSELNDVAKQFFSYMGIKVLTGVSGKIKDVVISFLNGEIHKIIEDRN
jgi:predicted Fe-Mo cluster-binding NifX family protein